MVHRGIMKLKTHNNMLGIPQIETDIHTKFFPKNNLFSFSIQFRVQFTWYDSSVRTGISTLS